MKVQDKIQDIFDLDSSFVLTDDTYSCISNNNFDELVKQVMDSPYLRNRVYKFATDEVRFIFSWCDSSWQEYLVHLIRLRDGAQVSIVQATQYKVIGGSLINE